MAELDINSILSSLSPDDIENLKKTAADLLGGGNSFLPKNQPSDTNKSEFTEKHNDFNPDDILKGLGNLGMPDLSQLSSLAPILKAFNSQDERLDFINSLKPLLSPQRQTKADEALKLVRLLSVLPLLKDRGIM